MQLSLDQLSFPFQGSEISAEIFILLSKGMDTTMFRSHNWKSTNAKD